MLGAVVRGDLFHASSIEPVVELCDVSLEVLVVDRMVGSEQEALQVGQRDVAPGEELVRRLVLLGQPWWRYGRSRSAPHASTHSIRR